MRTTLLTFVSGIFVCLITSIGVDYELDIYAQNHNEISNSIENTICENCFNSIDELDIMG